MTATTRGGPATLPTRPAPEHVAADPLGEALHALRVAGTFYCRSELTDPWGLWLPPMPGCLWFHVATEGRARLEVDGVDPVELRPGMLALVPQGEGHRLRGTGSPGAATPDVRFLPCEYESERYAILRHGGPPRGAPSGDDRLDHESAPERTRLVCGAVWFDHPAASDLVAQLPRVVQVEAGPAASDATAVLLPLMASESAALRPGGEAVVTRLADILVISAVRTWIERDPVARTGWLGALRDPRLGAALTLIHREPARPWSLDTLATATAMSRSAFAARFSEMVGEPAMTYVTRRRMHLALAELRAGDTPVAAVANRLGYRSEAAFSRAFKRVVGVPPGAVRAGRHPAEDPGTDLPTVPGTGDGTGVGTGSGPVSAGS